MPLLIDDTTPVISYFKEVGLLTRELKCELCNMAMKWTKHSASIDKYCWKCQTKECPKYQSRKSVRTGSFFSKSNLKLQTWLHAMYLWCERTSVTHAYRQLNISEKTVIDIYSFFREICSNHFVRNPVKLGGNGVIVQIDESCFSHKPKHHRGRPPTTPLWIFGIVDTSTSPGVGYMEIVERRNEDILLPIIEKIIRRGSIIYSDQWKAYQNITNKLGYTHETVNHSLHFVDKTTGIHTQAIESYWNKHKSHIKAMHGCKRESLNSYLQEFMWHERNITNKLDAFYQTMASQYLFVI